MVFCCSRSSELCPRTKLHSVILAICLFCFPIFAVRAYALDQDVEMAISSKLQVREQEDKDLQSEDLRKTELIPIPQFKLKHSNTKGSKLSELQGSTVLVQAMREQLESAKKLASFVRLNKCPRLFRELQLRIKENEQAIGASMWDADLPKSAPEKMRALRRVLSRATERHDKCEDMVKRLRSSVLVNEDKVLALKEENKFLGRLAARTMPKGFHCLALQLTIQYYNQLGQSLVFADETKLDNNSLLHYVVYTENILAATAIVNSTVFFAKEPHRHVFHVLTDGLNHAAMKMWFQSNTPDKAVVEVKNLENSNILQISRGLEDQSTKHLKLALSRAHLRQEENHGSIKRLELYFDLPEMFPKLDKVMVIEDDIVMRKDLTHLWEEDLHKKVIGALRSCKTSSNLDDALDWSCINMVDLGEWRRQGLAEMYTQSIMTLKEDLWDELTILHNNTHMLDDYVLDLDDTPSEFDNGTQNAVAIHYRGYAKPWSGMGVSRHRSLWTRFVNYESPLLQACNINK